MRSLALLILLAPPQEKKEVPPPIPRILYFSPLAIKRGATSKIVARGAVLDQVSALSASAGAEVKIKSKGKATVPKDMEASVYGDTQVEIEVKLPAEVPGGRIEIVATTPAGKTPPQTLLVIPADRLSVEQEPNGGFSTANPLEPGREVLGAIGAARDVDVFRIEGRAGERWTFEVIAQGLGSPLDASLSLYAGGSRLLEVQDDGPSTRDPVLKATLTADGVYFLTVIDAHDRGDATHVYLLRASREP